VREMTGSSSGGSDRGVMSVVLGDSDTRGVSTSYSEISSEMAIKNFVPYTCGPRNICQTLPHFQHILVD
jgi:hypothetical protein